MKIAISGKGGVGKSTISAIICEGLADMGSRVLAIDSDPSPHLARLLGFPNSDDIVPLAQMTDLLNERSNRQGAFYNLNPRVDDLPERLLREKGGIKLMVVGAVQKGGGGCACAENVVLRNLINVLFLKPEDAIVMDMEAGVEHLGRGTIESVDHLLVVVQPYRGSMETARKIERLATDLGLEGVKIVANQVASPDDVEYIEAETGRPPFFSIPFEPAIRAAERRGERIYPGVPDVIKGIVKEALEKLER